MQKFLLSLLTSCTFLCVLGQNTFPNSGSAGIGIALPTVALDIQNTPVGNDVGISVSAFRTGSLYPNSFLTFGSPRSGSADGTTIFRRGYLIAPGTSSTTSGSFFIGANTANATTTGDVTAIRSNQSNIEISSNGFVDFWKAGTNYARINGGGNSYFTGGNVGVGINNPSTPLDVAGTVRGGTFMAAGQSLTDQLTHNSVSMSHYALSWVNDSWQNGSPTAWLSGYAGIKLFTGGTNRVNIDINGNVGIGKIASAKLDVNGGVYANAESHYYIGTFTDPDAGTSHAIKVGSNGIAVSGNSVFSNGYVMIGSYPATMNTSYLLNVNGDARVNKLVVNTTGADFVFEPNYKLTPLTQLKQYVTTNRHLPGIATASTMQKDGVDVGDNQTKLLQKIEELTLYAIEQDKQTTEQKKIITSQGNQLQKLQLLVLNLQQQLEDLKAPKK